MTAVGGPDRYQGAGQHSWEPEPGSGTEELNHYSVTFNDYDSEYSLDDIDLTVDKGGGIIEWAEIHSHMEFSDSSNEEATAEEAIKRFNHNRYESKINKIDKPYFSYNNKDNAKTDK